MTRHNANLQSISNWMYNIVAGCIGNHLAKPVHSLACPFPTLVKEGPLAIFVEEEKPTQDEFVLLLLALMPHLKPDFFTAIIAEHLPNGGDFPEFGGVKVMN